MAKEKERRLTKNERKRLKAKEAKAAKAAAKAESGGVASAGAGAGVGAASDVAANGSLDEGGAGSGPAVVAPKVEVQYVSEQVAVDEPGMDDFKQIFEKFASAEELLPVAAPKKGKGGEGSGSGSGSAGGGGGGGDGADGEGGSAAAMDEDGDGEDEEGKGLSSKALKKMSRLSVAELKQLVARPDVVEAHDVTAADPRLLVYLKGYRNSVPVPRHWCHKRKYLQGKRGIEKPPFALPEFIAETGIEKIRTAIMEQEAAQSAKQKGRGRVAPKMGKIDIDYQVLHDAFFKYQHKPSLTMHGEVYYEGKEFEIKHREKQPGQLSLALREALAIPEGAPPPWLVNMQRYGPPPSYPSLRIPGLNAPIPAGASFGYQPGEWGKPPVDDYGRPLYGEGVFARADGSDETGGGGGAGGGFGEAVDKAPWGTLVSDSEESESEDEDDEDDEHGGDGGDGGPVDLGDLSGAETPSTLSGISSVASSTATGLETPAAMDLRKRATQGGMDTPESSGMRTMELEQQQPKELYRVVQQTSAEVGHGALFGSDKAYVLGGANGETVTTATNLEQLPNTGAHDGAAAAGDDEHEAALLEMQRKRKQKAEKEKNAKKKKKSDFKF